MYVLKGNKGGRNLLENTMYVLKGNEGGRNLLENTMYVLKGNLTREGEIYWRIQCTY